jgi:hydroxyacylglutathione hydrolase
MKRVNKVGPELIRNLPPVDAVAPNELARVVGQHLVIDTTPAAEFSKAHVPGTINVPSATLVQWAGFFVDYSQPVYLLTDPKLLADNLRGLRSIGIDKVSGYVGAAAVYEAGLRTEAYSSATPQQLRPRIESGDVQLLDVRAATEFHEGRIAGADHQFLGNLLREIKVLDKSQPIVAQCRGGGRSAIATSILQRAGFDVTNMQGGFQAWVQAGLPVERETAKAGA